jgi:hypothetical protein
MSYASLSDLRAYLKLGAGETGDDTFLTNSLARAQAFIESPQCCNRVFEASADSTRYQDMSRVLSDGRTLLLDYDLATTPTTVTNGDGQVIASTNYVLEPRNLTPYHSIRLKQSSGYTWSSGDDPDNPITIVAKWAYSLTAPTAIVTATLLLAKWLYRQKNATSEADQPVVAQGGFLILPSKLPTAFWDMVAGYKRR